MLHVHSDSVQIHAAPPVEPDHLPLRRARLEVSPKLFAKRTVFPSTAMEGQRLNHARPLFLLDRPVVSGYAR